MAFLQQTTDLYVIEGTSFYLAPSVVSLDVPVESDQFVQIESSAPLIAQVPGDGVTILGNQTQADVPLNISFNDSTPFGIDVDLTLSLDGDIAHVILHILDNDDPNRPTNIVVAGGSVAEDAAAGTLVGTLSTIDPTLGDTFTYQLINASNFVLGGLSGNEILVAQGAQLDFEMQPTQTVQVVTTDAAGHQFVKDVTINITDGNPDLDIVTGTAIQDIEEAASFQVDLHLSGSNGNPIGITGVSGDTDFFTLVNAPDTPGAGPFDFSLVFTPQDFEIPLDANGDNIYDYTISASDGVSTTTKTFHFTVTDVNEAPTAIDFINTVTSVYEDASTDTPIKVADIVITDDAMGTNDLFLVGADADSFELVGTELFLKAGVWLDFETKQSYSVAIEVDDSNAGTSPDLTSETFTVQVANVSPETLNGTIDGDLLMGSDDIEFIFGFAGNDAINGLGGNDVLTGGSGRDVLTGGTAADIFNFDLKTETVKGWANRDVIMDFNHVELDHIDLSDIDAKKGAGNQAFKFIGAKAFTHHKGELHYIKKAGYLLVEGDMDGNGKADFQIEVHGVTKLGALDFNL
jgi:Ca2+-binding RTX toxin-like protein